MTGPVFQKCTVADVLKLRELSIETFTDTYAHLNTKENFEKHITQAFDKNQLIIELQHPEMFFYLLQVEEDFAGYLKLNIGAAQTEAMPADHLEIERIYLKKAFQGKGLGRILIEKSLEVADDLEKAIIWLGVWEKNPKAVGFYKRMGFEITGTHVFQVGDDPQTDWVMKKKLRSW